MADFGGYLFPGGLLFGKAGELCFGGQGVDQVAFVFVVFTTGIKVFQVGFGECFAVLCGLGDDAFACLAVVLVDGLRRGVLGGQGTAENEDK